jgi:hypothetical protein
MGRVSSSENGSLSSGVHIANNRTTQGTEKKMPMQQRWGGGRSSHNGNRATQKGAKNAEQGEDEATEWDFSTEPHKWT